MATYDDSQLDDAQKLTAAGYVELFELRLRSGTIFRLKNNDEVTWRGMVWNGIPCKLSGTKRSADDERSRPSFSIANPDGVFAKAAFSGQLDRAIFKRRLIHRNHLDTNLNITVDRMWYVSRVAEMVRAKAITLELRDMTDGPQFLLPTRVFTPPEFPFVTL